MYYTYTYIEIYSYYIYMLCTVYMHVVTSGPPSYEGRPALSPARSSVQRHRQGKARRRRIISFPPKDRGIGPVKKSLKDSNAFPSDIVYLVYCNYSSFM